MSNEQECEVCVDAERTAEREGIFRERVQGIEKFVKASMVILDHAGPMSPQYVSTSKYIADVTFLLYLVERERVKGGEG